MKSVDIYEDKFAERRRMAIVPKKKRRRRRRGKGSRNREIVSKILSDRNSVDTAVSSKYDVVYIQHGVEDYNIDS